MNEENNKLYHMYDQMVLATMANLRGEIRETGKINLGKVDINNKKDLFLIYQVQNIRSIFPTEVQISTGFFKFKRICKKFFKNDEGIKRIKSDYKAIEANCEKHSMLKYVADAYHVSVDEFDLIYDVYYGKGN